MELREYQIEAIKELRHSFGEGNMRIILCSPTGSGKTVIFSEIIRLTAEKGNKCLVLTDRIELFKQTWKSIDRHGIDVQQVKRTRKKFDPECLVTVAMVETFKRRSYPGYVPDLIVIDEAHKGNFTKVMDLLPDSRVIGATATPVGKHLYQYFDDIVETIDIPELVQQEYLSPCRAFQMQDDFSDLKTRRGEYTDQSLHSHFAKRTLYDGVVDKWVEKAEGKKTLVFNVNISHAEDMHENFLRRGIDSRVLTSRTGTEERERILSDFASGVFPVLNNCGILTTGYDEPSIECIVMNRKTKSLPLWLQCCGRGSRIYPGKDEFIVLDFGMNHDELGLWAEKRIWKLEPPKKKKPQPAPVKDCPSCGAMLHASVMKCKHCDFVFPKPEPEPQKGVLVEITPKAPDHLIGKKISQLTIDELIDLQKSKKYSAKYIWRVIRSRGETAIDAYGQKMGYSSGWCFYQKKDLTSNNFTNFTIR